MRLTVTSFKGGVGKTTTALHLAGLLAKHGDKTLLIDGDLNRSGVMWAAKQHLPFDVHTYENAQPRGYTHVVIDTAPHPSPEDLKELARITDVFILPVIPDALSLRVLIQAHRELKQIGARYTALLNICPPKPSKDAQEARSFLESQNIPCLTETIPRATIFNKAALNGMLAYDVKDPKALTVLLGYEGILKELQYD